MTKKPVDRSKLVKGNLTESEYRELVYLPKAPGIVNAPKPEPVKPPEPSIVGLLLSWRSMEGNNRTKILQAIATGQVSPQDWAQARSEWNPRLGVFPESEIRREAEARYAKHGPTPSEIYYANADRTERLERGIVDTRSDRVIRKRRLQRLRDLL